MLNEEKIKIMNKLAMYEQGEGKKYLPVSRYYRSDYIGLAMIKNFFLVTIGYCLILAGIAVLTCIVALENSLLLHSCCSIRSVSILFKRAFP